MNRFMKTSRYIPLTPMSMKKKRSWKYSVAPMQPMNPRKGSPM